MKAIALTAMAAMLACGCDSSIRYERIAAVEDGIAEDGAAKSWKAYVKWPDGTAKEMRVKTWREMSQHDSPDRTYFDHEFEVKFMTIVSTDGKTYVVPCRDVVLVKE